MNFMFFMCNPQAEFREKSLEKLRLKLQVAPGRNSNLVVVQNLNNSTTSSTIYANQVVDFLESQG